MPTGHIVYALGSNLFAIPFNLATLSTTGGPVSLVGGVLRAVVTAGANYGVSDEGSLVYVNAGGANTQSLVWVDRAGKEEGVAAPPRNYNLPRLSPDSQRVAVANAEGGGFQVWLYDLRRNTLTRSTFEGTFNVAPAWTPDGRHIAFASNQDGAMSVFWQRPDGSGGLERLTTSQGEQYPSSWSPDGRLLVYVQLTPTPGQDIWVLPVDDPPAGSGQERKPQVFLQTAFNEAAPSFSPDGHRLAYVSDESSRNEIYVQPYPGPGGKSQISTDGGTEPVWNPNGRELFYRSGDKMMAVEVATGTAFSTGKPRLLFQGDYAPTPFVFPNYDVSADGQRFLMIKSAAEQGQSALIQINVVLNWTEELKQRVPTGTK